MLKKHIHSTINKKCAKDMNDFLIFKEKSRKNHFFAFLFNSFSCQLERFDS